MDVAVSKAQDFSKAVNRKVKALEVLYAEYNKDGFKMQEVAEFVVKCMVELVAIAKMYDGLSMEARKQEILDAVEQIYKSHNPDIPWVPEPFETMLESMLLDYVVPALYNVLVK